MVFDCVSSQAFIGGGYRLGAAPEEESAYVAGERRASSSQHDVSAELFLGNTAFLQRSKLL